MKVAGVADLRALPYGPWPENAVYCGRAQPSRGLPESKWHNPNRLLPAGVRSVEALAANLARYDQRVRSRPDLMTALPELDDKLLLSFCTTWQGRRPYPGWRCHCDVLADLVAGVDERPFGGGRTGGPPRPNGQAP